MMLRFSSKTMAVITLMLAILPSMGQTVSARESLEWGQLKALGKNFAARRREPVKPEIDTQHNKLVAAPANQPYLETADAADLSNPSGAVWLYTQGEGIYTVPIVDAARAMGLTPYYLRKLASRGVSLALTRGASANAAKAGNPVAWYYDRGQDALLFVGEAYDTFHTGENAYLLQINPKKARPMAVPASQPPQQQGSPAVFSETLVFEQEPDFLYSLWSIKDDPDADFWFWDYLYGGYKDEIKVDLQLPAPAAYGTAQLRVSMRGWTELETGNEHHVYAELNGQVIGTTLSWDGFNAATLVVDFDQALLNPNGENTLRLLNQYTPGSHPGQWLDAIEVDYGRATVASGNQLWLHGLASGVHEVSGFSSDDIIVIENPGRFDAKYLQNISINGDDNGGWSVTFNADQNTPADYLVVGRDALHAVSLAPDILSGLGNSLNRADYLIIAPRALAQTASALAAHRGRDFGAVKIAWLEDIYNEFSAGRRNPEAITRFMQRVRNKWQAVPNFVTLIGKGSIDHKNRMGYADSFLPVSMTTTPWSLTASDDRLLGVDGEAPYAIGRIPVTSEQEGLAYVDKIMAYESSGFVGNPRTALLIADNPDRGGDFHANSDEFAQKLVNELGFEEVGLLYHPNDPVREACIASENWETGYVNYAGHGSTSQAGDYRENFLTAKDASLLVNTARPVFTALTCATGNFSMPGTRSLADALVLNPSGGAIASFSPTGLSLDEDAQFLGYTFVDNLFGAGYTIGQAAQLTKNETNGSINDFMRRIYTVIGDPALHVR